MKPILTFDLNGSLTDFSPLDPFFQHLFGSADKRREWFAQVIELAMATSLTRYFVEFGKLAESALQMMADRSGLKLLDEQKADLLNRIRNVPLFPDVEPGLKKLKEADYRLVVLTNSALSTAESTLHRLDVAQYFERILSVEMVRCYKPAQEVYIGAARELQVGIGDILMVAAHDWDTTGAIRAGAQAAFLTRPGEVLAPTDPRPSIIARDVPELAEKLAASE